MYLQITTRCNMLCAHCSMRATERGRDMSLSTFKSALQHIDSEGYVQLGGGEPTLHPRFWEFVGLGLSTAHVWLATNGSQTDTALRLCNMARRGVIGCALSYDDFHSEIDYDVFDAFAEGLTPSIVEDRHGNRFRSTYGHHPTREGDRREIRDTSHNLGNYGRARDNGFGVTDDCVCPELIVKPDGTVRACGCPRAPKFGNVRDGFTLPDYWSYGECYKKQETEVSI